MEGPPGGAERCLACLSGRMPRLRLTAAKGLELLAAPAAFAGFVAGLVNDQGEKPEWKIPGATVDALAELLAHGEPRLRARAARLLRHLDAEEQAVFDQAWAAFEGRFAPELAELRRRSPGRKPAPLRYSAADLKDLAFGAYVGLVREQGGSRARGQAAPLDAAQVARVRRSALGRLLAMAESDPRHAAAARPVFVQAMGDPNQAIRSQAFEQARAVGMAASALASEALAVGHPDLGVKGLEVLTGGASEAEARAVLERAMMTRLDPLCYEAAKLLIARRSVAAVASQALEGLWEPTQASGS